MKPTVGEWMKAATGGPPGWCHAGGQHLGWGAREKAGDIVPCELCGKRVKLRDMLSRNGVGFGPGYPRHKAAGVAADTLKAAPTKDEK